MRENIYIIGCGGFAKEVYGILKDINKFTIKGFVCEDNTIDHINLYGETIPLISEDYFFSNIRNENIVISVGSPKIINKIRCKYLNYKTPNIIHPTHLSDIKNIKIGIGNIITQNVIFTTNIEIGSFNIFNLNMTVGHDCIIGDMNVFNPSVNISGNCNIGNGNLFGVGCVVLENMEIGENNILGAASLINKKINNNGIYVGIPAKHLKNND